MEQTLKIVGVANYEHLNLKRLKEQIAESDVDFTVLGMDDSINFGWENKGKNFGFKLKTFHEYLKTSNPDDIVVFIDLFDVLFYGNKEEIISRYNKFNSKAVFSSEYFCHPFPKLAKEYPPTDSQYKYLNSGTFMGQAGYLLKMMNKYPYTVEDDDQGYWTRIFLSEKETEDIKLDYKNEIFNCTAGKLFDIEPVTIGENRRVLNITSRNTPNFIHFNGNGFLMTTYDNWIVTGKKSGFAYVKAVNSITLSWQTIKKNLLYIIVIIASFIFMIIFLSMNHFKKVKNMKIELISYKARLNSISS